jgi:hypothetical protein
MVKYSQLNAEKGDKSAMSFAKKFRLDLITIPDEYKDEGLDDIVIDKDRRTKRQVIRNRTNRDLTNYDAWICHDRYLMKGGGKNGCIRKI